MADTNHYWDEMDDLLDAAADDPGITSEQWAAFLTALAGNFTTMAEAPQIDRAARVNRRQDHWSDLPAEERCPECGQPDNCGDCNHAPLTDTEINLLKGPNG